MWGGGLRTSQPRTPRRETCPRRACLRPTAALAPRPRSNAAVRRRRRRRQRRPKMTASSSSSPTAAEPLLDAARNSGPSSGWCSTRGTPRSCSALGPQVRLLPGDGRLPERSRATTPQPPHASQRSERGLPEAWTKLRRGLRSAPAPWPMQRRSRRSPSSPAARYTPKTHHLWTTGAASVPGAPPSEAARGAVAPPRQARPLAATCATGPKRQLLLRPLLPRQPRLQRRLRLWARRKEAASSSLVVDAPVGPKQQQLQTPVLPL